ncbi:hypothetical protein ABK040_012915 [Willaertia magna]
MQQNNFEEKMNKILEKIDEVDKERLGESYNDSNKSTTVPLNFPKGLTLDDMSFWLNYKQNIDYTQPSLFSLPQKQPTRRKIKAAPSTNNKINNKSTTLIEEIPKEEEEIKKEKIFCIKRKRQEEPLETFYIPSIQQQNIKKTKTKIEDELTNKLQKQLVVTQKKEEINNEIIIKENKVDNSIITLPKKEEEKVLKEIVKEVKKVEEENTIQIPLYKFTLLKRTNLKEKSKIDNENMKRERMKEHEKKLKEKRLLRINEKRKEGDNEIIELSFITKEENKELISPYEGLLSEVYGVEATKELTDDEEYEYDYYKIETTTTEDERINNIMEDDEIIRFESFDDQLWLENNYLLEYDTSDNESYDSEDSNDSNNPNYEYPEERDSSDDDEYEIDDINGEYFDDSEDNDEMEYD